MNKILADAFTPSFPVPAPPSYKTRPNRYDPPLGGNDSLVFYLFFFSVAIKRRKRPFSRSPVPLAFPGGRSFPRQGVSRIPGFVSAGLGAPLPPFSPLHRGLFSLDHGLSHLSPTKEAISHLGRFISDNFPTLGVYRYYFQLFRPLLMGAPTPSYTWWNGKESPPEELSAFDPFQRSFF